MAELVSEPIADAESTLSKCHSCQFHEYPENSCVADREALAEMLWRNTKGHSKELESMSITEKLYGGVGAMT